MAWTDCCCEAKLHVALFVDGACPYCVASARWFEHNLQMWDLTAVLNVNAFHSTESWEH